jgi:L-ascorbate metabolism protein UlaG (beta-lactamase superfamily)
MKGILKALKVFGITVAGILLLLVIFSFAYVNMSPQFGKSPSDDQQKSFVSSPNYREGKFYNQIPTSVRMNFRETAKVMKEFMFSRIPDRNPARPLPFEKLDSANVASRSSEIERLTWFGHSAILLETQGKKILIDPMLGQHAGPLPLVSPKRYNKDLPLEIERFPFIDVVLISHDHYDHLDHGSILKLKDKVGRFFVPLGVGNHLRSWGVAAERITELDWWDESQHEGFTFICAPARHFSGRGFTGNNTLWSSWIIQAQGRQLFFSGDSGYGPHFKEIGDRYGPMDVVMMECGQYDERWAAIHMMPEETIRAAIDVKGKFVLPIHWGAFSLAMHTWTDPIERAVAEANKLGFPIITPKIGEPVIIDQTTIATSRWWE